VEGGAIAKAELVRLGVNSDGLLVTCNVAKSM
jgi:hypothetical protein